MVQLVTLSQSHSHAQSIKMFNPNSDSFMSMNTNINKYNIGPTIARALPSYWQITQHTCCYNRSGTYSVSRSNYTGQTDETRKSHLNIGITTVHSHNFNIHTVTVLQSPGGIGWTHSSFDRIIFSITAKASSSFLKLFFADGFGAV